MRLLLIEDDPKIGPALKRGLELESYAVDLIADGDDALEEALADEADLIILDWMLPGSIDGLGILRRLREEQIATPVIFLTARDALDDKLTGLDTGADDYLVKPFALDELAARIRALLRRPKKAMDAKLSYNEDTLDPDNFTYTRDGSSVALSAKEYALLDYLMRHPEQVVSKQQLIDHAWNFEADVLPNTVEVYIGMLRNKIDKPFSAAPRIHTRRGLGYWFGKEGSS